MICRPPAVKSRRPKGKDLTPPIRKDGICPPSNRGVSNRFGPATKVGLLVLAFLAVVVFSLKGSGDYGATQAVSGDNAAPGIEALLHGDVAGYFARQPLIGLTTIVLRLPFAAVASAVGGDDLSVYKLGALACVLPLALAAGWLLTEPGISRRHRLVRLVTVAVVVGSPLVRNTLEVGHPEDVTAAVAATAAVLLAMRDQPRWSAVTLGLAVGAKEWALIAALPVMLALPRRRLEVVAIAAALVMVLVGLPWLVDPSAMGRALHAQRTDSLGPLSPLWPVATPIRMLGGGDVPAARTIPWGLMRTGAASLELAAAALAGGAWYAGLRRRGLRCNPLCLLAMLAAVRCVCDTAGQEYYWLALLVPVAAWECLESRVPVATVAVTLTVWLAYDAIGHVSSTLVYGLAALAEVGLMVFLARQGTAPLRASGAPGPPRMLRFTQPDHGALVGVRSGEH